MTTFFIKPLGLVHNHEMGCVLCSEGGCPDPHSSLLCMFPKVHPLLLKPLAVLGHSLWAGPCQAGAVLVVDTRLWSWALAGAEKGNGGAVCVKGAHILRD